MLAAIKQKWYRRESQHTPMCEYLKYRLPDRNSDYRNIEFLAADLELTSLDAQSGEIVCVAYVPVIGGKVVMSQASRLMVKTSASVGDSATIHGIHDRELEQAVTLEYALERFLESLRGRVLLLHHAPLDMQFLNIAFKQLYAVPLIARIVDTLKLEISRLYARGHQGESAKLRLYQCRERYHLPVYKAHDALSDAVATAELFLAQAEHIAGDQVLSLKTLLKKSG